MTCGTIENHGQVTHVVVAGGNALANTIYVDTVFIYDVEEDNWTTGLTNMATL